MTGDAMAATGWRRCSPTRLSLVPGDVGALLTAGQLYDQVLAEDPDNPGAAYGGCATCCRSPWRSTIDESPRARSLRRVLRRSDRADPAIPIRLHQAISPPADDDVVAARDYAERCLRSTAGRSRR